MGLGSRIENYFGFERPLVWKNIMGILAVNIALVYSIMVYGVYRKKFATILFTYVYGVMGTMGITTGSHRLWTHKTYKAKMPLRIWIMFWYLSSGMYGMVQWCRDHRTHHKFADTNADPHNVSRGLFFSHCGWLMMKRHPELKEKGKTIDVSDVMADPVVQFSEKYFYPLVFLCLALVPASFGHYVLKESWKDCIIMMVMGRLGLFYHHIWLLNSWTHYYGYKPYNKNIRAVNNRLASYLTCGEGWHNFHHTFPWDYRIGEYGQGTQYGTSLIDFYAWLGQAYDRKEAHPDMIKRVLAKNGELPMNEVPEVEDNHCNEVQEFNNAKEEVNVQNGKVKDN